MLIHNEPLALLKAMAEKLIPGIPHPTRIAILQQSDNEVNEEGSEDVENVKNKTVLDYVMSGDGSRNEIMRKVDCMPISPIPSWL